jgi:hypothetical protein
MFNHVLFFMAFPVETLVDDYRLGLILFLLSTGRPRYTSVGLSGYSREESFVRTTSIFLIVHLICTSNKVQAEFGFLRLATEENSQKLNLFHKCSQCDRTADKQHLCDSIMGLNFELSVDLMSFEIQIEIIDPERSFEYQGCP